jgi:hypothetical protein
MQTKKKVTLARKNKFIFMGLKIIFLNKWKPPNNVVLFDIPSTQNQTNLKIKTLLEHVWVSLDEYNERSLNVYISLRVSRKPLFRPMSRNFEFPQAW